MGGCMFADARPILEQYHEARWWYKDKEGWMTQYAWVLEVRPGYEEEYVHRHPKRPLPGEPSAARDELPAGEGLALEPAQRLNPF
jgi:hypothetical protein